MLVENSFSFFFHGISEKVGFSLNHDFIFAVLTLK